MPFMHGHYDLRLVALSVVIAILASGAALDLAGRVAAARGRTRALWLAGGAFAMGLGIWSMHFIGMEAFQLPVPVLYNVPLVLASLVAAVFASAVALLWVAGATLGPIRLSVGAAIMGVGIAAMHYTGMAAMRMPASLRYRPGLFAASVVIAIVVSLVALVLAFRARQGAAAAWDRWKVGSSLLMGAAIPAMHYTGMAAAVFTAAPGALEDVRFALPISSLTTVAIGSASFLILALAIWTSVLDRHLASQAGELSRLAAIVESSHDAILATTLDGTITSWNPGARRLLGYAPDEALGRPMSVFARPERADAIAAFVDRIRSGEQVEEYETVAVRKDGSSVDVSVALFPIRDREGGVTALGAIVRDIAERKRVESAMRHARDIAQRAARTQGAFLANMSHEIRTPMNAILGLSELVLDTELAPEQRRQLELVHGAAEGLLAIINDILDFSKIEGEHLDLEAVPVDLRSLADTTVALLESKAREREVALRCDVATDVPRLVRGDPGRLRQVLTNLLGNAVKFTERGTVTLTITAPRQGDDDAVVAFSVSDTGIGIAAEKLQSIFEAFSQADASTTRKYGGTGLGLAISQRLVRLMGGELEVKSEVGRGTKFSFVVLFPLERDTGAAAPAARLVIGAAARSLRLLLAEDNAVNQEVAAAILRKRGHHVDIVGNGREAVEAATRERYDVVLMDIQMPEMDGLAATRAIRTLLDGRPLRIVALTAHASGAERERCLAAGMDGYLSKPFKSQDLFALVEEIPAAASPSPVDPAPSVLDLDGFRATMREAGAEEAVEGIMALFAQGAPDRLATLVHAIVANNAPDVARAAHAFRSAAATIGAHALAARLEELERSAREGTVPPALDTVPLLERDVANVLERIKARGV